MTMFHLGIIVSREPIELVFSQSADFVHIFRTESALSISPFIMGLLATSNDDESKNEHGDQETDDDEHVISPFPVT